MTLNDYQVKAVSTAIYPKEYKIIYPTLGLSGEAGEVADKVKKVIRDKGGFFGPKETSNIIDELGDVLWYIGNLANDLGYDLQTVAERNVQKLEDRAERNALQGSGDNR